MTGGGRDAADNNQREAAAKNGHDLVTPWPRLPRRPPAMPGRRPGLLTIRLTLLVGRLVGLALMGRLAWIWLLLSVRLLRRIRWLTLVRLTLPLV